MRGVAKRPYERANGVTNGLVIVNDRNGLGLEQYLDSPTLPPTRWLSGPRVRDRSIAGTAIPPQPYRSLARLFDGMRPKRLGHSNKICERPGFHLPHHTSTVKLDRDLAEADLGGDLLIHEPSRDMRHDLAFPGSQYFETSVESSDLLQRAPPRAIASERDGHGV